MPLEPGARFGPYEIVSPAGAGGMGEVYRRATHGWTALSASRFLRQTSPEILCASSGCVCAGQDATAPSAGEITGSAAHVDGQR